MPLYDYQCEACGTIIEDVFKRSTSGPEIECPNCKALVTQRHALVGNSTFKLKGRGWYKDGYDSNNTSISVK